MVCRVGHDHGSPLKLANCRFFHKWLPQNQATYREMEMGILDKHNGQGLLTVEMPMPGFSVRFGGNDYPIEALKLFVHVVIHEGAATHKAYERHSTKGNTRVVHHFQGVAGNKKLSMLVPATNQKTVRQLTSEQLNRLTPEERQAVLSDQIRKMFPEHIVLKIDDANKQSPRKTGKRPK